MTTCESSLVLVVLVIVLALVTVGSGYAALYANGGAIWDVVFLALAASLLVVFIRFLMTLAAATMHSGDKPSRGVRVRGSPPDPEHGGKPKLPGK